MGKSLETTKGSVWALFLTAHAVLVEEIEVRLADAGLPPLAWYDVLWALERAGDRRLRMRELAHMAVISRSNLTPGGPARGRGPGGSGTRGGRSPRRLRGGNHGRQGDAQENVAGLFNSH